MGNDSSSRAVRHRRRECYLVQPGDGVQLEGAPNIHFLLAYPSQPTPHNAHHRLTASTTTKHQATMKATIAFSALVCLALGIGQTNLAGALPHQGDTLEPRRPGVCCDVGYGAENACRFFSGKTTCSVYPVCPDAACQ